MQEEYSNIRVENRKEMALPPFCTNMTPKRSYERNNIDSRTKLLSKTELKSSIPVPTPIRRREPRSRSSSSRCSQQIFTLQTQPPFLDRDKTSLSLFSGIPKLQPSVFQPNAPKTTSFRPRTVSSGRNPYPNVKAKIDSLPTASRLRSPFRHPKFSKKKSNESVENSVKNNSSVDSAMIDQDTEVKTPRNDEILEKQKQLLKIYAELKKMQPSKESQPLEVEICSLMENKALGQLEGLSQENSILKECAPEFLTTFEKQMRDVSETWLQLINDIITTKMTMGKTALSRLSFPDPSLDLHDEISRFLTTLPTEGEPLHEKLRKIEEEQLRVMTVVMHNVVALTKEHEDLKDKHSRLEKTQDQIHYQLKEELAILGQENKELDRKYTLAVEKYNLEKSKTDQQEKHQLAIHKEMLEIRKISKIMEGRCNDVEVRTKRADTAKRTLEVNLRNIELSLEKEGKQHRELFERYGESEEIINKLKYELEDNKCNRASLEAANKELQAELNNVKASLEENVQKRNELVEDLSNKSKKLNEMKEELNLMKSCYNCDDDESLEIAQDFTSTKLIKDLHRDVNQRNVQIQELKKKVNHLEKLLQEKTSIEQRLSRRVQDLMNNRTENSVVMNNEFQSHCNGLSQGIIQNSEEPEVLVAMTDTRLKREKSLVSNLRQMCETHLTKDLRYKVKDLESENARLEKIITEKTLELDQRDLLMQEHAKLLQVRDELIPMIQNKQANEKACTEKLLAVIYEHYRTRMGDSHFNKGDRNPYETIEELENYYGLNPTMVDKEMSFRQEKMAEMFNLLELKQMEINKLERRINELQGIDNIDRMEKGQKANKARGFFSMFSAAE